MNKMYLSWVVVVGVVLLLVGSVTTVGQAQYLIPQNPQGDVGTAFTYQGRLLNNGSPVNGTCDFRFNLYDDNMLSPTQVAGPVDRSSVTVSDGYFSTSIDFGSGAFTGQGRQLEILVRCPAGSGSYTTLSGMVWLAPAPYALSLQPGAEISSDTAGGLGAVLYVEDTYDGMFASAALKGQSTQGTGVYGAATANSGLNYGVYGETSSSSGYGVYSHGNAHVEGDLTWRAKTSYISVSAAAFRPMADGYDYDNRGDQLWNLDNASDGYVASVQLPHGATVTSMTFYWWDGTSTYDGHCTLYRTAMDGTNTVVMAEAWTSGDAATNSSSQDDSIVYATVDNSQYSYYLYWDLPVAGVGAYGVVIEYTITEPY